MNNASTTAKITRYFGDHLMVVLLSVTLVLTLFLWQGNVGLNLWDEGYLWYGAQRVAQGEVPIRDFRSYDPGRYYWSALGIWFCRSDGIVAVRVAAAIFQTIGLFCGLAVLRRYLPRDRVVSLVIAAVMLLMWMYPRHKLFDASICLSLLAVIAFAAASPSARRFFMLGVAVGVAALFGRNHGVYGVMGSVAAIICLHLSRKEAQHLPGAFSAWFGGVVLGYLPMLALFLFVPGFAAVFADGVRWMFELKTTNLAVSVPWPWNARFAGSNSWLGVQQIAVGIFFVGVLFFGAVSLIGLVWWKYQRKPVSPLAVSACSLSLPYAHFAYSRADVAHLAQSIFPLLIWCFAVISLLSRSVRTALYLALFGLSTLAILPLHPGWIARAKGDWQKVQVGSDLITVDAGTAGSLQLLSDLKRDFAPEGVSMVVLPVWPGGYAVLQKKSPVWDTYPLFPIGIKREEQEIQRIRAAQPGFVLVVDVAVDGRNELRFAATHPLMESYLRATYKLLTGYSPDPTYQIYVDPSRVK